MRQDLERQAGELGLAGAVLFLGDREVIQDILASTDVSVLTSEYEGLPNALLESMAAGVAIVTTDYAGVRARFSLEAMANRLIQVYTGDLEVAGSRRRDR